MIKWKAEKELIQLAKQFKAVAVVGPRQSGKTTLALQAFPNLPYISLENPESKTIILRHDVD